MDCVHLKLHSNLTFIVCDQVALQPPVSCVPHVPFEYWDFTVCACVWDNDKKLIKTNHTDLWCVNWLFLRMQYESVSWASQGNTWIFPSSFSLVCMGRRQKEALCLSVGCGGKYIYSSLKHSFRIVFLLCFFIHVERETIMFVCAICIWALEDNDFTQSMSSKMICWIELWQFINNNKLGSDGQYQCDIYSVFTVFPLVFH